MGDDTQLHAVILAGGAGERFWPASRHAHPKPFLEVVDGRSLLDATVDRAVRLTGRDRVWVVCGADHAGPIRDATGLPAERVLVEPARRNTAMAVGYGAVCIAREEPEAVLAVLSADHRIPDENGFSEAMRAAAAAAAGAGVIVSLGIRPTRADPGYGYIQLGPPADDAHPGLHRVLRFVEKPDPETARRYFDDGGYVWNAGIFAWTARTILEELEACAPDVYRCLGPLRTGGEPSAGAVREAYECAPSLPIDEAVLERSQRVWTLPVDFHWSDVGTWESLAVELGVGPGASRTIEGDVVFDDTGGNLVWMKGGGDGRAVALLGVEGLAVIDTGDALLVARLDRSADVRSVVSALKTRDRTDVT